MNIAQVTTELRPAGAERVVLNLCRGLRDNGHEVTVISIKPLPESSFVLQGLLEAGVHVRSLDVVKRRPLRLLHLRRLLRQIQPDLVHGHLLHANMATRLAARGRSYALVNTVHVAERRSGKQWHFWLDRLTFGRIDCETVVSKAVRDYHAERLGIDPERLPVIYNGIDAPVRPDSAGIAALRQAWGVSDCARVIGSVGRLDQQKGYDILLAMLPQLSAAVPAGETWAIVLIGEGPLRPRLEALIDKAPANLRVVLTGFRADAASCPGAFDLFVMPSRHEGFGLSLAEAMAHGIPVLVNAIDSLPELVNDYTLGATIDFTSGNANQVVARLIELAQQPVGRPDLRFTTRAMVANYLDLYRRLRT